MSEKDLGSFGAKFDPSKIHTVADGGFSSVDELFPGDPNTSFRWESVSNDSRLLMEIKPSENSYHLTASKPLFFGQVPVVMRVKASSEGVFLMQMFKTGPSGQPILDESRLFKAEDLYYGKIVIAKPNCFVSVINAGEKPLALEFDINNALQKAKPHLLPSINEIEFARRAQFLCHVRKDTNGSIFLSRNHFIKPGGIVDVGHLRIL